MERSIFCQNGAQATTVGFRLEANFLRTQKRIYYKNNYQTLKPRHSGNTRNRHETAHGTQGLHEPRLQQDYYETKI